MLLHVVQGVFISIHELEVVVVEAESSSHIQILGFKVLRQLCLVQLLAWLLHTATLQKLTTEHTWSTEREESVGSYSELNFLFIYAFICSNMTFYF